MCRSIDGTIAHFSRPWSRFRQAGSPPEEVPADAETVERLIATARRHIASATTNADSDPEGALALAYDAARKTATALLGHQGLRPTSAGGHIAVVEPINAQFPGVEGLKSIDRLRRRRNQAEYPDPRDYDPVTKDEVDDAIAAASACVNAAETNPRPPACKADRRPSGRLSERVAECCRVSPGPARSSWSVGVRPSE